MMSKSMQIIDTPRNCSECERFLKNCKMYNNKGHWNEYEVHPQCPLQPVEPLIEALEIIGNQKTGEKLNEPVSNMYEYTTILNALGGKNE